MAPVASNIIMSPKIASWYHCGFEDIHEIRESSVRCCSRAYTAADPRGSEEQLETKGLEEQLIGEDPEEHPDARKSEELPIGRELGEQLISFRTEAQLRWACWSNINIADGIGNCRVILVLKTTEACTSA